MNRRVLVFLAAGCVLLMQPAKPDQSGDAEGRNSLRLRAAPSVLIDRHAISSAGTTIRVPQDHATIQAAIAAATQGDTVIAAENTYSENINFLGKAIIVASEYLLDLDTSHIRKTIIDGSQHGDPDSGSVVCFISGEDTMSVLCGFTIRGGTGTYLQSENIREGGGILCYMSGARIVSNIITRNVIRSSFHVRGGGVSIRGETGTIPHVILEQNEIVANVAGAEGEKGGLGGGVAATAACIRMDNNIVKGDSAYAYGGGSTGGSSAGGGLYCNGTSDGEGEAYLRGNAFVQNVSENHFGPSSAVGGAVYVVNAPARMVQNRFVNNVVTSVQVRAVGGAVSAWSSLPAPIRETLVLALHQNYFEGNLAHGSTSTAGGAISVSSVPAVIHNNIIVRNYAPGGEGGGISFREAPPAGTLREVVNNTILENQAYSGGGLYISHDNSSVVLNTILWDNTATSTGHQVMLSGGSSVNVHYCLIKGGWPGQNNIDAPPNFADSSYSLAENSPCIGAGVDSMTVLGSVCWAPTCDCHGDIRPQPEGSNPDIGAVESPLGDPRVGIDEAVMIPKRHSLSQNYPNPFNPSTTIEYALPHSGYVTLKVYSVLGEEVASLISGDHAAGRFKATWDASDMPSGVYFYRLTAGEYVQTKKAVLMR